jgi:hypothetical protein
MSRRMVCGTVWGGGLQRNPPPPHAHTTTTTTTHAELTVRTEATASELSSSTLYDSTDATVCAVRVCTTEALLVKLACDEDTGSTERTPHSDKMMHG